MESPLNWKSLGIGIAVGTVTGGALFTGYQLLKRRSPSRAVGKLFLQTHPLSVYVTSHNTECAILSQLRSLSVKHERGRMTTDVDAGKLLTILTKCLGARKALDVGVFTGCSGYAMALGLSEGGKVIACDVSEEYTSVGKPFWAEGGVAGKIDLHLQPATQTLQELIDSGESGTFDLMFIDADKVNYVKYYEMGVELLRPGGLIVVDNALRGGRVANPKIQEYDTATIRQLNARMKDDTRVDFVLLNLSDGIGIAQKL